jgi:cytidylate kinase
VIVTISRAYGANGKAVGAALAAELSYRLVDEELPRLAALRLGTTPDVVRGLEDRAPGIGERIVRALTTAHPETGTAALAPLDDAFVAEYRREVAQLVREAAAPGDVVIVGRFAGAILGPRPGLLRAFLRAELAWRVAAVQAALDCDAARARDEIARVDEARRSFARAAYGLAWGDAKSYDLVLDTSRFGVAGTAGVLAAAVRAAAGR